MWEWKTTAHCAVPQHLWGKGSALGQALTIRQGRTFEGQIVLHTHCTKTILQDVRDGLIMQRQIIRAFGKIDNKILIWCQVLPCCQISGLFLKKLCAASNNTDHGWPFLILDSGCLLLHFHKLLSVYQRKWQCEDAWQQGKQEIYVCKQVSPRPKNIHRICSRPTFNFR